uniref:Uncharacterized protein n=1 Tax=Cacopsylla melanoneura TaxID=428564 RepID=A0A8D9BXD7_9HEMI
MFTYIFITQYKKCSSQYFFYNKKIITRFNQNTSYIFCSVKSNNLNLCTRGFEPATFFGINAESCTLLPLYGNFISWNTCGKIEHWSKVTRLGIDGTYYKESSVCTKEAA